MSAIEISLPDPAELAATNSRVFAAHAGAYAGGLVGGEPASLQGTDQPPAWWTAVASRFRELALLEDDWDGRGSKRLFRSDIYDALQFLRSAMDEDTAAPWIGPLSSGGVQLVWRSDDGAVEVDVTVDHSRADSSVYVQVGEHEWDEPLQSGVSLFRTVVDRLRAAPVAG